MANCNNPFCNKEMTKHKNAPRKLYCSPVCRMDGHILKRAGKMIDRFGILPFFKFAMAANGVVIPTNHAQTETLSQ
jgi:hypothetical protein